MRSSSTSIAESAGDVPRSPRKPVRSLTSIVIWILVAGIAAFELLLITLYSRPDAVERCRHVVPPPGLPPETVPENLDPVARLSLWPLGLECSYSAGGTTVVAFPDWFATIVGVIGFCLAIAGVWLFTRPATRRRQPRQRRTG